MPRSKKHPTHVITVMWLVVGAIVSVGCGPTQADLDFQRRVTNTKNKFHVSDIRSVVQPLYRKYNHPHSPQDDIPPAEVPKLIYSLPIFSGAAPGDILAFALDTNQLMFMMGSGFGHRGIIICDDKTTKELITVDRSRIMLWADGVFFYRE